MSPKKFDLVIKKQQNIYPQINNIAFRFSDENKNSSGY